MVSQENYDAFRPFSRVSSGSLDLNVYRYWRVREFMMSLCWVTCYLEFLDFYFSLEGVVVVYKNNSVVVSIWKIIFYIHF
jgi:hypothetical protein